MPGLQFEKLPAAQVEQIGTQLHSQWQIEANALSKSWFSNRGQFETAKAKLNAKYQRLEFDALTKIQQQQEEQQRVQELIGQGTQDMGREEEAALRMQLKPEAESLVFPKQGQPYSISALQGAISKSIVEFADAAEDTSGWEWGPPKKTRGSLLNRYMGWRELIGYDNIAARNPHKAYQLDLQWDAEMREDDRFDEWWVDEERRKPIAEVGAMRVKDRAKIGKAVRERVTSSAAAMTKQVTPIGESVRRINIRPFRGFGVQTPFVTPTARPKEKPRQPSAEQLRRLGTTEAFELGINLGYWKR